MNVYRSKVHGNQWLIQLGVTPIIGLDAQGEETSTQRIEPLRKDGVVVMFKTSQEAQTHIESGAAEKQAKAEADRLKAYNAKCQNARRERNASVGSAIGEVADLERQLEKAKKAEADAKAKLKKAKEAKK